MSDKQIEAAVAKLNAMRLDELPDLFAPTPLAAILSVKAFDRPAYEKLLVKWKQMGFSSWNDLKIEVGKLEKKLSAPGSLGADGQPLDPRAPLASAKRFRAEVHPTLLWYQSDWLLYRGSHYDVVEADKIKADIYEFVEKAGGFDPDAKKVGNIVDALKGVALAERGTYSPPCWLEDDELGIDYPADEILACRNGLLHLQSKELMEPTPRFFTRNGLPYNFDPAAPEPRRWLKFCDEVWVVIPHKSPCCRKCSAIC